MFSGHVSSFSSDPVPPNSQGTIFLVQSSIGQPIGGRDQAIFLFGQPIKPDPALGADPSQAPDIDPPGGAIYIADKGLLFGADSGIINVTWKNSFG